MVLSSHVRSHFFRHVKGRRQTLHNLEGRLAFATTLPSSLRILQMQRYTSMTRWPRPSLAGLSPRLPDGRRSVCVCVCVRCQRKASLVLTRPFAPTWAWAPRCKHQSSPLFQELLVSPTRPPGARRAASRRVGHFFVPPLTRARFLARVAASNLLPQPPLHVSSLRASRSLTPRLALSAHGSRIFHVGTRLAAALPASAALAADV